MFSSNYYALVAGFREYALDAETKGFDIADILAEIEEVLSASDWQSVRLLYTYYDCENLVARRNGSSAHNALGLLSAEQVEQELDETRAEAAKMRARFEEAIAGRDREALSALAAEISTDAERPCESADQLIQQLESYRAEREQINTTIAVLKERIAARGELGAIENELSVKRELLTQKQIVDSSNSEFSYNSEDMLQQAQQLQQMSEATNTQLIWIASISLLVGGIGVMNIMLVSVTERTAEIGLKKAIGAKKKRILWQFLTESAVLTSLGGIIGVVSGIVMAQLISAMTQIPVAISVPAIVIAVVFSTLIGVVFGMLPAVQAANLNPIEALRRE